MASPRRKSGLLGDAYDQDAIDQQNRQDNPQGWGYVPPTTPAGGAGGAGASPAGTYGGSSSDIISRLSGSPEDPNQAMLEMLGEGFRLRDEGEQRRTDTLGFLGREQEMASKPTLTDEDVRRMGARESDRITSNSQAEQRDIQSWLGSAGIFGGQLPAALLASSELSRMGQVLGSRRDIRIQKAQTDALDRAQRFQRAQPIAALMNEDPNMVGLDTLTNVADWRTQLSLGNKGVTAAQSQASATRSAGQSSMFGSIIGGLLGAL